MKSRLLLIALLASFSAFGQDISCDIIETKNGDLIEARIIEISSKETKYKMCDYIDGPTKIINNREIYQIEYANGVTDIINPKKPDRVEKPKQKLSDKAKKIFGEEVNSKMKFEVVAGLNASNAIGGTRSSDSTYLMHHRLLYRGGVNARKQLTDKLYYNISLIYSAKGYGETYDHSEFFWLPPDQVDSPIPIYDKISRQKLNFVSNRQTMNLKLFNNCFIQLGCEFSYLITEKQKHWYLDEEGDKIDNYQLGLVEVGPSYLSAMGYPTSKYDIAIITGLSFRKNKITSNISFEYGLIPMYDYPIITTEDLPQGGISNPPNFYNRTINFNVSYLLSK